MSNNPDEQHRESQADILVNIVKETPNVLLFLNELDEPYIQFPTQDHLEHWPTKSKQTRRWLAQQYWSKMNKAPNEQSLNAALNVIEGLAAYGGQKFELSNRVAMASNALCYFLANENWEVVLVNNEERKGYGPWSIIPKAHPVFRRYSHQEPQSVGTDRVDIWNIFKYINIKSDQHKLLFLVWIITCFIPNFPHPIIFLHGPQGSAKTTASKILRKLIDPSKIEVAEFPKDMRELIQKLSHHWFLMFDNVSHISAELSDLLCRAVSGTGFSKRELYSDDSDIIYSFQRCIGLNGINLPRLKPDLLERCILLSLDRVSKDSRRQERDVLSAFEQEAPGFLATIFDVLHKALELHPTIQVSDLPRMADFTLWGCAITEALGRKKEEFLEAYNANISLQHDEVINDNVEAMFVVDLMEQSPEWKGTASDLLELMKEEYAGNTSVYLPKSANVLSRRLMELKTNLAELGITIERQGSRIRHLVIRRSQEDTASTASSLPEPSPEPKDDDPFDPNNF